MDTTQPGDSIELGLLFGSLGPSDDGYPQGSLPNADSDDPLLCTIRISHRFVNAPTATTKNHDQLLHPKPIFSKLLLCRLLHHLGATLTADLPPPKVFQDGRTCDFTLTLQRGCPSIVGTPMVGHLPSEDPILGEPSVEQLTLFAEGLRGKRVTLYASPKGSFARHLTSYLTAWGMIVTYVSPTGEVDTLPEVPSSPMISMQLPLELPSAYDSNNFGSSSSDITAAPLPQPTFIFIDDDIEVLKDRLRALRTERAHPLNPTYRKRPSLAAHHRPRSSPLVPHSVAKNPAPAPPLPSSTVIVHFTSLSNYKLIKEIVHSVIASHTGSTVPIPEVMTIPKPAGPRRFLTALYTAMMKPVVDPFFSPIATSPNTPSAPPAGSFFHSYHNAENNSPRSSPKTPRPCSPRTNSGGSSKSVKDVNDNSKHPPSPSPLAISDSVEYFSEAAVKLGTSPSSGLVIQSPDGQPAGIFFHPRQKSSRTPSAQFMERDKGHLRVPSPPMEQGKRPSSRLSLSLGGSPPVSMSSLHTLSTLSTSSGAAISWTAASPSARAAVRKSPRPTEGQVGPSTSRRRATTTSEGTTPGESRSSPGPARRAAALRRTTAEGAVTPSSAMAAASKKAKAAGSPEGNIVPPISVLIVDGEEGFSPFDFFYLEHQSFFLVVDNPINQTILSAFMRKKGIRYEVASNGQEAVQKWKIGGFHLILVCSPLHF